MAFRMIKLVSIASSSYSISVLIAANNKNKFLTLFTANNPLLQTWIRSQFCTEQAIPKAQVDTLKFEDDAKTNQEFFKWCNGGGTFHKAACIHPTAVIEVGAVVHSQSLVGANAYVGSGAIVGPAVTIGKSTRLGYNISLSNCSIGNSCVLYNGVCIGQDGFGFFVDEQGNMVKKPQNMKAKIGNYVEIGANTCIDRGSWRDTIIGDHTKIDNLVQIGHNVAIGKSCIICGQVGIAGSATIGDYVTLGGRVAIRDHICIASKVRLAANSCVTKDINQPGDYGGFPAMPITKWRRQVAAQNRTLNKENYLNS